VALGLLANQNQIGQSIMSTAKGKKASSTSSAGVIQLRAPTTYLTPKTAVEMAAKKRKERKERRINVWCQVEADRWPATKCLLDDEPRALPWAGMKQAFGLRAVPP